MCQPGRYRPQGSAARGDEVPEDAHEQFEEGGATQEGVGGGIGEPAPRDHELEGAGEPLLAAEAFAAGSSKRPKRRGVERAAIEGGMRHLGKELGGSERGEDALAREGVIEARRVPDQHDAARPWRLDAVGERAHGLQAPHRLHPLEPGGEPRQLPQPRAEKGLEPAREGAGMGQGDDEAQIDETRRDGIEDRVVGWIDEDLTALVEAAEPGHVLDEGHAPEGVRTQQSEGSGNGGGAPVGADHEPGPQLERPALGILGVDARDVPALLHEPRDPVALAHVHGQAAGPLDEDVVQPLAGNGQRVVPVTAPGPRRGIGADDHGAVGRHDLHAAQRLSARPVHGLEGAQPVENARGLRRQVLAADLGTREGGLVEQGHAPAALGEENRRGRTRGARAHHDHVARAHVLALTAQRRKAHA